MAKFNVGDKVIPVNAKGCDAQALAAPVPSVYFEVHKVHERESWYALVAKRSDGTIIKQCENYCFKDEDLQLIETNITKKIMTNIVDSFQNLFRSEPEKSFRKAGIVGADGFLTTDGARIFIAYLLQKNGAAFKTDVVDGLLAEAEKCNKC